MFQKSRILLSALVLALTLSAGCTPAPPPATQPSTAPVEVPPSVCLQLPEAYQTPMQHFLQTSGYGVSPQLQGCQLLITSQLPVQATDCPVLLVDRTVSMENVYCLVYDRQALAAQQVAALAALPYGGDLNRDGVVSYAIISPTGTDFADSCSQALAQTGLKTELLSRQACKDDAAVASAVCGRILATYGRDLDVLFCGSHALSQGAALAVRDSGRRVDRDLYLAAADPEPEGYSLSVFPDSQAMLLQLCDYAQQLLTGRQPPAQTLLPLSTVIPE